MTLVGTVHWTFLILAVAATAVTFGVLLWSARERRTSTIRPRSDRRRQAGMIAIGPRMIVDLPEISCADTKGTQQSTAIIR